MSHPDRMYSDTTQTEENDAVYYNYNTVANQKYKLLLSLGQGDCDSLLLRIQRLSPQSLISAHSVGSGTYELEFTAQSSQTRMRLLRQDLNGQDTLSFYVDRAVLKIVRDTLYQDTVRLAKGNGYRYGFNGKEQNPEWNGVGNMYDFGARIYDARLGRWLAGDPLESEYSNWTPYNFALNSPIRLIDILGYGPGDPFGSEEEALEDFADIYNTKSIRKGREYAAIIYSYEEDGVIKYSYTKPNKGSVSGSSSGTLDDDTKTRVSIVHTHANYLRVSDNSFSDDDIRQYAMKGVKSAYVVTPSGTVLHFKGFDRTTLDLDIEETEIEAPSDPVDPDANNNKVKIRLIDKPKRLWLRWKAGHFKKKEQEPEEDDFDINDLNDEEDG